MISQVQHTKQGTVEQEIPMPKERYQDQRGQFITVKSCMFNRVVFIRDGYPAECVYSLNRFEAEFTLTERTQA
ncbi:DUF4222 domain-containing protein [Serratia fonticola]|uniref:DUF4222 domain-containing protein n=1 Tax=Serratia fonticola TaxID=47917 RepID=UPI00192CF93A|nr:DUF4222 domain-containing protein [Serratia fonticola]MBL5827658.1 DUF4222 domain-containing protein [Serratia fonticola]